MKARVSPPPWVLTLDRALGALASKVALLEATTPVNLRAEIARVTPAFEAGNAVAPAFEWPPARDLDGLRGALDGLAEMAEKEGDLGRVYGRRAAELGAEVDLMQRVGSKAFAARAKRRYKASSALEAAAAERAQAWLATSSPIDEGPRTASDDERDPRSLVRRMRAEIQRLSLPFTVRVRAEMAPLAAVGDEIVWVAAGRSLTEEQTQRTVTHELLGHAVPRARARGAPLGIFAFGTAKGSDHQEGRALCIEEERGHLVGRRRRELALRHVAAVAVHDGALFVEVVRMLRGFDASTADALSLAARACRGGGLGRERVYLTAYFRVNAALARDPAIDLALGAGRVAVDAVEVLRPWLPERS